MTMRIHRQIATNQQPPGIAESGRRPSSRPGNPMWHRIATSGLGHSGNHAHTEGYEAPDSNHSEQTPECDWPECEKFCDFIAWHFLENDLFTPKWRYGKVEIIDMKVDGCNYLKDDPPYEWVCSGEATLQCHLPHKPPPHVTKFFVRLVKGGKFIVRNEDKLCEYRQAGCTGTYPNLQLIKCTDLSWSGPGYCIDWW